MLKCAVAEEDPQPHATNKSGRPPIGWWDDMWVEIFRQIYEAEIVPKRQVDIEKAMLSWASANGHEVSEMSVRLRARKLFAALNKEDKN